MKRSWELCVLFVVTVLAFQIVGSAGARTCRQFSLQLNDGTPPHTAIFAFFS